MTNSTQRGGDQSTRLCDIPGTQGLYKASSDGRIYSVSAGQVTEIEPSRNSAYLYVRLGNAKKQAVHRLVASAFFGPCPDGKEVNHIDADKHNNRPENLEYLTHGENIAHAAAMGLMGPKEAAKGENHGAAKSSEADALAGYELVKRGEPIEYAAKLTGVGRKALARICSGQRWKHLNLEPIGITTLAEANRQLEHERAAAMKSIGMPIDVILEATGMPRSTLYRRLASA